LAAIKKNLGQINRYPDSNAYYLRKKLAKYHRVGITDIVLGNGSDELIDIIIKTFVAEDENIITADTTFLEYGIIAKVNNRALIEVPLKYFKYDLGGIKNKIDKKTKLIFIANPNNPTGTYVTRYELEEFILGLPQNVILVLDEAYDIFIDVDDYPNGLSYLKKKNILVLKTFSKAYGLAGLRVGYAIGNADLTAYMQTSRQPFNVNSLAQVAALAALEDKAFLKKSKEAVLEGKNYIYDALNKIGLSYVPSVTNFILIDTGKDGLFVFNAMLRYGVIVRDMQQYGLKNFIRVTVGTKKENERFVKVLKKVL
jgi:histidinol-phosphate aminotransferase